MPTQQKWNSDKIFRRTTERKQLYDEYVASLPHPLVTLNITDCIPPVRVKGKLQPRRAFDEKQDLWCAKDFWREALEDKSKDAEDPTHDTEKNKQSFRQTF